MSIDVITSSNNIDSNCKEYNSLLEITMEMVAMPNIIPTKDWSSNLDWKMHLLHKFQPTLNLHPMQIPPFYITHFHDRYFYQFSLGIDPLFLYRFICKLNFPLSHSYLANFLI